MFKFGSGLQRKAFVLGIADYDHSAPLVNTIADAKAVSAELRLLGFDVADYYDLDFINIVHHLTKFLSARPEGQAGKLDAILIYYAGHGIQLGDQNYIVPKNFNPHASFPLGQLISIQRLLDLMDARAEKKLLFLDACRDSGGLRITNAAGQSGGSFEPQPSDEASQRVNDELGLVPSAAPTRSLKGATTGLARPSLGRLNQTFIAFAADPGEKALDGPADGNSPFTTGVLRYINRRGFDVFDMCQCVARDVRKDTKGSQVPWTNSNLIDQFEFHRADRWPELVMLAMGMIAGVLTALFAFDLLKFDGGTLILGSGRLHDITEHSGYLLTSGFLGIALGIGALMYSETYPKGKNTDQSAQRIHAGLALTVTCAIYMTFAIVSRYVFAPIAELDKKTNELASLKLETLQNIAIGHANLSEANVALLIAVLFFAIVAGALTGVGSVIAGAPFHHEMCRATRMVSGAIIGAAAPLIFFLFLYLRLRLYPNSNTYGDGVASVLEVVFIILLVSIWQGLLAWNAGRGYAKPRYDDT